MTSKTTAKTSKLSKKSNETSHIERHEDFVYTSQSISSVVTSNGSVERELSVVNENGKVQGTFVEKKDGKQIIKKDFKSQRGLDAISKLLASKQIR